MQSPPILPGGRCGCRGQSRDLGCPRRDPGSASRRCGTGSGSAPSPSPARGGAAAHPCHELGGLCARQALPGARLSPARTPRHSLGTSGVSRCDLRPKFPEEVPIKKKKKEIHPKSLQTHPKSQPGVRVDNARSLISHQRLCCVLAIPACPKSPFPGILHLQLLLPMEPHECFSPWGRKRIPFRDLTPKAPRILWLRAHHTRDTSTIRDCPHPPPVGSSLSLPSYPRLLPPHLTSRRLPGQQGAVSDSRRNTLLGEYGIIAILWGKNTHTPLAKVVSGATKQCDIPEDLVIPIHRANSVLAAGSLLWKESSWQEVHFQGENIKF